MKTAEEVINENWGHHAEAPHDIVIESMEQYAEQFKQKWVSVEDGLPEDKTDVLIVNIKSSPDTPIMIGFMMYDSWYCLLFPNKPLSVTHWTHLPKKLTT